MKRILLTLLFLTPFSYTMNSDYEIKKFNPAKDSTFVFDLLDKEKKHIMIGGHSTDDAKNAMLDNNQITTHVLFKNNTPIGFISFSTHQYSVCCFKFGNPEGRIDLIAIDANHRKKGFGKLLLTHAIQELKKESINHIGLYVNQDNQPAITLYKKLNFQRYSLIPNFFFQYYSLENQHHPHSN